MRSGPKRPLPVLALALGLGLVLPLARAPVLAASPPTKAPAAAPAPYVVAIAPGHGGYDPGAVSPYNGLEEKTVTLAVGMDLRGLLQAEGVRVAMTRTTDKYVSIAKMEAVANNSHADLFVSLWVNDWSTASLEGVTVFTPHSSDTAFADAVDSAMGKAIAQYGMGNRGVQPLPQLWVHATMPTVTIESGFMSNQQDSQLLARPGFQEALAQGVYAGILAFAPQVQTIHTEQLAYRAAQLRAAAASRLAAAHGRLGGSLVSWGAVVLLAAVLLFLALYRDTLGRLERWCWRRTRSAIGARLAEALDASPRSERRPRPSRGRPAPPPRPATSRRRPPPRRDRERWRAPGSATRPQRVVEMVHPEDSLRRRRERGSVYDDLPL